MKLITTSFALCILVSSAYAHYDFPILLVNGTQTKPWQYVRDVKPFYSKDLPPSTKFNYKPWPQYNDAVLTRDHRYGREAWKPSPNTSIADVVAGSSLGFKVGKDWGTGPSYESIFHIGPGFVYLAKKPDGVELAQWDGDGDWVKIDYKGPVSDKWPLFNQPDYNFTIPKTTPPGQYLLRVEHIYPRPTNESQFYVNCAQINVIGPGGGTPTGFAKFPGTYNVDGPGVTVPDGEEYYDGSEPKWRHGFLQYVPPGPAVWTG